MSGNGLSKLEIIKADTLSVAIVAARWHDEICQYLIENSERVCALSEVKVTRVYRVAGCFDLLAVTSELSLHYDAVIALGVLVQGETPHFEYISRAVNDGLARISIKNTTPIGNGVLTAYNLQQAWARCGAPHSREDKGSDATLAAIDAALTLCKIRLSHTTTKVSSKDAL